MRVVPDTNVILRAVIAPQNDEDAKQAAQAQALLKEADLIVVTAPMLCEFVWVARRAYKLPAAAIAAAVRKICDSANVVCDRPVVDAGLDMLVGGGDFADGAIAQQGFGARAEVFYSFDRRAVSLVAQTGRRSAVPS